MAADHDTYYEQAMAEAWGPPHRVGLAIAILGALPVIAGVGPPFVLAGLLSFLGGLVAGGRLESRPEIMVVHPEVQSMTESRLVHGGLVGLAAGGTYAIIALIGLLITPTGPGLADAPGGLGAIAASQENALLGLFLGMLGGFLYVFLCFLAATLGGVIGTSRPVYDLLCRF